MKSIFKWFAITIGSIALLMSLFFIYMRMHDGPVEFVPGFTMSIGGPFRSGKLEPPPDNWDFLKDREEIEMETLNLGTSKTIWVSVVDGRMFVASGRRQTWYGQLWKQWPQRLEDDDRIILRFVILIYVNIHLSIISAVFRNQCKIAIFCNIFSALRFLYLKLFIQFCY